jgi:ketosteroid isomerase-like protein
MAQHMPEVGGQKRKANGHGQDPAIDAFMQDFAKALTAGDAKTIASMWDAPAFVISDQGSRAVSSRGEVEQFFSGVKEQYSSRGINEARPEIQFVEWATERVAIATVRWPYIDAAGREIGEESSTYTLRRDDAGELKLVVALMRGEKRKD